MKALMLEDYRKLAIVDFSKPAVGASEVLVQVKACGICGSDVHGYDGSTGRRIPPLIMGHEASGVVAEVGDAVSQFRPGDRVTFDSTIYCGHCFYCCRGRTNLCESRQVLGVSCTDYRRLPGMVARTEDVHHASQRGWLKNGNPVGGSIPIRRPAAEPAGLFNETDWSNGCVQPRSAAPFQGASRTGTRSWPSPTGPHPIRDGRRWGRPVLARSGRTVARSGLRMMPAFPRPSLKFRTAGSPSVRLQGRFIRRGLPGLTPGIPSLMRYNPSAVDIYRLL
ncbi:MAG: alcohol dehydrogenase catalytic domain-containing protein [Acidobacteriota bacterium]